MFVPAESGDVMLDVLLDDDCDDFRLASAGLRLFAPILARIAGFFRGTF